MNRRFPPQLVLLAMVLFGSTGMGNEPLSRGHRWIRQHPFTTMALTIIARSYGPEAYQQSNMTTTLAWKERTDLLRLSKKIGLPWHLHVRRVVLNKQGLTPDIKKRLISHMKTHPGGTGWLVFDEPNRREMFIAAETIKWLKQQFPQTLVYSNAYPRGARLERYYGGKLPKSGYSYEQYLRDFANITGSDVVMYDGYIFLQSGKTRNPFVVMMTARKIGLETGKPYWTFVQAYQDDRRGYRMPSESDLRMHVFSHLTAGYSGIAYFTFEDQQGPALVNNATLKRRPIYHHVARLNKEIKNVGRALRFLQSTEVRYLAGSGNQTPLGLRAWQPGAGGIESIKSIAIKPGAKSQWRDLLVGFFRDDNGHRYLMLTNLWHGPKLQAVKRQVTVTLTLSKRVRLVGRLSRKTGQAENLRIQDGKLQLTLPGGTGDLLRIGSTRFPGK